MLGKGVAYKTSCQQKLNTKSSTENKLVAIQWPKTYGTGNSCQSRVCIFLHQKLSRKQTCQLNIRYLFATDKINKYEGRYSAPWLIRWKTSLQSRCRVVCSDKFRIQYLISHQCKNNDMHRSLKRTIKIIKINEASERDNKYSRTSCNSIDSGIIQEQCINDSNSKE